MCLRSTGWRRHISKTYIWFVHNYPQSFECIAPSILKWVSRWWFYWKGTLPRQMAVYGRKAAGSEFELVTPDPPDHPVVSSGAIRLQVWQLLIPLKFYFCGCQTSGCHFESSTTLLWTLFSVLKISFNCNRSSVTSRPLCSAHTNYFCLISGSTIILHPARKNFLTLRYLPRRRKWAALRPGFVNRLPVSSGVSRVARCTHYTHHGPEVTSSHFKYIPEIALR